MQFRYDCAYYDISTDRFKTRFKTRKTAFLTVSVFEMEL